MDFKLTGYDIATGGVASQSIDESVASQMPGRENGPADAYRHILLAAELTRKYGEEYARALLDRHEETGNADGQRTDSEAMDRHNNEIGIKIGKELAKDPNSTWNDVVKKTRDKFDPSTPDGEGARWLPVARWRKNPIDDATNRRMTNTDPKLNWPPQWPDGPFPKQHDDIDGYYDDKTRIAEPKRKYDDARRAISPLILDLNGDGVQTTDSEAGAYFDHDGDGFAEQTGWVSPEDGLLVRDLDGDGQIDTGRELFGNQTRLADGTHAANGFDALTELDSNQDGKIDAADSAFSTLQVWQDANGDGLSSADELHTLTEVGVQSISTGYTADAVTDPQGNAHKQIGTYTTATGATRAAEDVWFQVDNLHHRHRMAGRPGNHRRPARSGGVWECA